MIKNVGISTINALAISTHKKLTGNSGPFDGNWGFKKTIT